MLFFRQIISAKKLNLFHRCYSYYSLNFSDSAVLLYLKNLILEHDDLNRKPNKTVSESRRFFEIKPVVNLLEQRMLTLDYSIESLKELSTQLSDDSLANKMIKEEALMYLKRIKQVDVELQSVLLEPQLSDGGVLLKVTAGTGGQDAMLFARDLFQMYESYAKYKDWEVNIASLEKADIGGIKYGSMLLEGLGVLELMKMECGVHYVQRIPVAAKDRVIHTNTVSVAILPQPTEVEVIIPEDDILIETKPVCGTDGKLVNPAKSVVRILHIPTETVVKCQEGKSLIKNKEIAMQKLRTLLLERQHQEQQTFKVISGKKSQIDYSNRFPKIRTYNYPKDRVIEHREGGGTIRNLQRFMEGTEVLDNLQNCLLRKQKENTFLKEIQRVH